MAFDSLFIGVTGLTAYPKPNRRHFEQHRERGHGWLQRPECHVPRSSVSEHSRSHRPRRQTRGGVNAQQVGDGVKIGSIDTDFTQGGLQTTGVNTNLAINGDGFFTMNNIRRKRQRPRIRATVTSRSTKSGYLYDQSSGLAVLGYPVGSRTVRSHRSHRRSRSKFRSASNRSPSGTGFGVKDRPDERQGVRS